METSERMNSDSGWNDLRSRIGGEVGASSMDGFELPATGRDGGRRATEVAFSRPRSHVPEVSATLVYLDPRTFTRDCIGRWLQGHLNGFSVCALSEPEEMATAAAGSDKARAVIINAGPERMSSPGFASLMARVGQAMPGVPVAVLSDYEDSENIRAAFELGVRGYITTSLASLVAVQAVHLVCAGGTFAPAAALLSSAAARSGSDGAPAIEGFTQRQAQILDCLRRGMANKLIAYELDMCESTVKVHIRNIMKKLNATNRTQVVYLTNSLFDANSQYRRAD